MTGPARMRSYGLSDLTGDAAPLSYSATVPRVRSKVSLFLHVATIPEPRSAVEQTPPSGPGDEEFPLHGDAP